MSKKLMHVMVEKDTSDLDLDKIYESLSSLKDDYNVVVTTNDFQISLYDPHVIHEINNKLDAIISELDSLKSIKNDISREIKYVFGIKNC